MKKIIFLVISCFIVRTSVNAMHEAVLSNNMAQLMALCAEQKELVNKPNGDFKSPLHLAVHCNNTAALGCLLEHGADRNVVDSQGRTPLHYAALSGNISSLTNLLNNAVSLNPLDCKKETPLYLATVSGQKEAAYILLERGANPNLQNNDGNAPLHAALLDQSLRASANRNMLKIIRFLVGRGADVKLQNNEHKTPLDLAPTKEIRDILAPHQAEEVVAPVVPVVPAAVPVVASRTWSQRIWNLMPSKKVVFSTTTLALAGYVAWRIWRR
jgi:ankyrin repeat protein